MIEIPLSTEFRSTMTDDEWTECQTYLDEVSRRLGAEFETRLLNLFVYGTTHPEIRNDSPTGLTLGRLAEARREMTESTPSSPRASWAERAFMNSTELTPEVDYAQELDDGPTVDEMWAKMADLGILRDD